MVGGGRRAVCLHQSSLRNKLDHSRRFNFSQSRSSLSISRQLSLHLHYPLCPACRRCQCRPSLPTRSASALNPPPNRQRRPGTSKTAQPACAACVLPQTLLSAPRVAKGTYRPAAPSLVGLAQVLPCPVRARRVILAAFRRRRCATKRDLPAHPSLHSCPPATKGRHSPPTS